MSLHHLNTLRDHTEVITLYDAPQGAFGILKEDIISRRFFDLTSVCLIERVLSN